MFGPSLSPGVEEDGLATGFRIGSRHAIGLKAVAESAGEPQILFLIRTAATAGNKVFNLQLPEHKVLRAQAVSASMAGLFTNTVSYFLGNVSAHG